MNNTQGTAGYPFSDSPEAAALPHAVSSLIRPLPERVPLDIVGDVHGEWQALQNLLRHLGYGRDGRHAQGRRLVFVGDLCDRGPNSPAVLRWVLQAAANGYAFPALGNHELNLLIHDAKDGSGWFFRQRTQDEARYAPWQTLPEQERRGLENALAQWPLAWQRSDIRIVHAAWLPESLHALAQSAHLPLAEQYRFWETDFRQRFQKMPEAALCADEQKRFGAALEDENAAMPFLPGIAHYDWLRSRANPIRALTSGIETLADAPFYINGRWRFTVRMPWWQEYADSTPVVIGHYWRHLQEHPQPSHRQNLFDRPATYWLGKKHNVFCVDFSVGARWRERRHNTQPARSRYHLAALRWPEKELMLDNGTQLPTHHFARQA